MPSHILLFLPEWTATRIAILVMALLLDAVIGDPRWLFSRVPHPVVITGGVISWLERRLNNPQRGHLDRKLRGVLVLLLLGGFGLAYGSALSWICSLFRQGWFLEVVIVATLLAQRDLYDHVHAVMRALTRDGLPAARVAVGRVVGRNTDILDEFGVARAGIESLAENFSDGVVAPVIAYIVSGLPGLLLYKIVSTLDSMIGHRNARYLAFGWASARCDDVLNLLPARLSGLLLTLAAAFVPQARPFAAFATMWRDAGKHRSPNAGWPESAMAGALDLSLGGPRRYGGVVVSDPWFGTGRARASPHDMRRALFIFVIACILQLGLLGGLALALTA